MIARQLLPSLSEEAIHILNALYIANISQCVAVISCKLDVMAIKTLFSQKNKENIWRVTKIIVPLHPLSKKKREAEKERVL